ncbi:MAG: ABC transporter ATP-binding protein [Bacteriovoracaceae bacterium]|nr:ABC transporter ATP-binding protein [Bacteriovoracaceae bacterium]
MTDIILEIKDLFKSFKDIHAVNGASFKVTKGTCFGLLGPNGAGKSTTIEMVEKITSPDSGVILYKGEKLEKDYLNNLGVQFQQTALPPMLTVKESIEVFRNLYPNPKSLEELITLCQLGSFVNQRHDKISGGQRQRLLLALALCHNPELILLDEPTTGLDPQARRHLWDIVRDIKSSGKSVILTTHYMEEAFELCDEIAIMDKGKIIAKGTPKELLSIHFKNSIIQIPPGKTYDEIKSRSDLGEIHIKDHLLEIHTENLNDTLKFLTTLGLDLTGLNIRHSNLEDLFIHLTGKELRS